MRISLMFCLAALAAGLICPRVFAQAAGPDREGPPDPASDMAGLQGAWDAVSIVHEGETIRPPSGAVQFVFSGFHVLIHLAEQENVLRFAVHPAASPRELDTVNAKGETVKYIYRLEGDQLTLCTSKSAGRPTDFSSKAGEGRSLVLLRRGKILFRLLAGHPAAISAIAFLPDGRRLASADLEGNVKLWDLDDCRELRTIWKGSAPIHYLAAAPDGATLAFTDDEKTVVLWDLRNNRVKTRFPAHAKRVNLVQYSADGRMLICGDQSGEVRRESLAANAKTETIPADNLDANHVAVSRGGRWLAFFSTLGTTVTVRGGWEPRDLHTRKPISSVVFSPDSRMLAACLGGVMPGIGDPVEVVIWDPSTGHEVGQVTIPGDFNKLLAAQWVAFSPDNRILAISVSSGLMATLSNSEVILWDMRREQEVGRFRGIETAFSPPVFSPDGKTLATGGRGGVIKLWNLGSSPQQDESRPSEPRLADLPGPPPDMPPPVVPVAPPRHTRTEEAEALKLLVAQQATDYQAGRFREAEAGARQMLAIVERSFADNGDLLAMALETLAEACAAQSHYADAEASFRRAVPVLEKMGQPRHMELAELLGRLGSVCYAQVKHAEAERFYRQAVELREKGPDAQSPGMAGNLSDLCLVCSHLACFADAEKFGRRAIAILDKAGPAEEPQLAQGLNNLALLYSTLGRFMEAEPLYQRAIAIQEKAADPRDPFLAQLRSNLGLLYGNQHRHAEAERLYKQAIETLEQIRRPDDPDLHAIFHNLANVYLDAGRYAEAEPLYQRVLSLWEKKLGPNHPGLAMTLESLATLRVQQSRYAEAEPLYRRALFLKMQSLGPDHPRVAYTLCNLARLYKEQHRDAEAEPLANLAIGIMERNNAGPGDRFGAYNVRAQIRWNRKHTGDALADLHVAMDTAEQQRTRASGGERERAAYFSEFLMVFERMVQWQTQLGNLDEALGAMERSRARSLLDQLDTQGIDLLAGADPSEVEPLRSREAEVQLRLAKLDQQFAALGARRDLAREQQNQEAESLDRQLRKAREDYAAVYAGIRNASPAYRLAIGKDRKPVPLSRLQQWAAAQESLVLEYLLGANGGYVLAVPPHGAPQLETIAIEHPEAEALGVSSGPLTAERLSQVFNNEQGTGLLQQLRQSGAATGEPQVTARLAALWRVLIPKAHRELLCAKKYQRLVILPDAAVAPLPFEVLVVEGPKDIKYLLDVGPPVQYAPSAGILLNLAERGAAIRSDGQELLLTLGDAVYGNGANAKSSQAADPLATLTRYSVANGSLKSLPFTAWETDWVQSVFQDEHLPAVQLKGPQATEANVRAQLARRRFIHLACHGLVDQAHGNLFGALAFTPGPSPGDSADDGFLTLAEIYGLNVYGCELTILSACDTNVGPEQRGEGVWAISRGFLVAGARRVVATSWLVDDEAAASLVSYFFSVVARAEKQHDTLDYAKTLHDAKRWVRQQEKWQHPYYWGNFVLLGPN
jgi:uncharacterized protein (TIGR03067 family)